MSHDPPAATDNQGIYQTLPPGNYIRYLVLEPGTRLDPIICGLEQANLDNAPDFEAVSYVWGSSVKNDKITCNNKTTHITANLSEALRRVRDSAESRALWADSICINQENDEEKGHQVGLMGQIYSQARRVLIHIAGDDEGHAVSLASFLSENSSLIRETIQEIEWGRNHFPFSSTESMEGVNADPRLSSLLHLCDQPWFQRGWVVQEAALARQSVILWGPTSPINFEALMMCLNWLKHRHTNYFNTHTFNWNLNIHAKLYLCRHEDEAYAYGMGRQPNLLDILDEARKSSLTDARDRIFAFLHLDYLDQYGYSVDLSDGKPCKPDVAIEDSQQSQGRTATKFKRRCLPWSFKRKRRLRQTNGGDSNTYTVPSRRIALSHVLKIQPDYTKSTAEVYTNFARKCFESGQIRLLDFVEHSKESLSDRKFPSWAPRWDVCESDINLRARGTIGLLPRHVDISNGARHVAGTNGAWHSVEITRENVLILRGVTFDRVHACSQILDYPMKVADVVELWQMVVRSDLDLAYPEGDVEMCFLLTLSRGTRRGATWAQELQALVGLLRDTEHGSCCIALDEHFPWYLSCISEQSSRRRLVCTARGYVGIAPQVTEQNDLFCILFGGSTPFILRKYDRKTDSGQQLYQLVGDVWIPGRKIMRGVYQEKYDYPVLFGSEGCLEWADWGLEEEDIYLV